MTIRELSGDMRGEFMQLLDRWYAMFPEPFDPAPEYESCEDFEQAA